ncbi:hypothetical protein N0V85_006863 [Neurospora sp. IMI 360204]|nr:hypothetical protein N0V85_006863 [Neurospora sp. IMI 360204]
MDEDEDASMMSVDDNSSSTDPLLETAATPASRSVTPAIPAHRPASARRGSRRNQPTPRTQRVQALRESTPRKRMFELDVGDAQSPQRLLVTVEAESSRVTSRSSVSRRLFQHSTPTARSIRERERTTSVTVPLRGVEDDGDDEITRLGEFVTPRPRGRPSRTATPGTALRSETPKTTTRPMRPATPGFRLRERRSSSKDVLDSDVTIDFSKLGFTPGTKRRISLTPGPSSRAPKRRKGVSPVRQPSLLGPGSARRKRGRPRKDSIAHDEFSALIDRDLTALKEDDSDHEPGPEAQSRRDQQDRDRNRDQEHIRRERIFQRAPSNVILGNTGVGAPSSDAPRPDESEGDLWLDNSFNPPQDTPAARRWNGAPRAQPSRVDQLRPEPARRETPQLESELSHGDEYVEFADFGGGESHSDIESELDDDNATPRDTPVQPTETRLPGEEFTMIDPYSLLSMQQNSSYVEEQGHEAAQNEDARDGDTTSFYIKPRDYDFQYDLGSHANVGADDDAELDDDEHRQPTESAEPALDDEMPSSPPTGSFSRHEQQSTEPPLRRVRSNSNETPADRLTSLTSPGLPALNPQNLMPPPDSQNRPALSPIIRAGEALRQVTSDPPSPPAARVPVLIDKLMATMALAGNLRTLPALEEEGKSMLALAANAKSLENRMLKAMVALATNAKSSENRMPRAAPPALKDPCKRRLASVDEVRPTPALTDKPMPAQALTGPKLRPAAAMP